MEKESLDLCVSRRLDDKVGIMLMRRYVCLLLFFFIAILVVQQVWTREGSDFFRSDEEERGPEARMDPALAMKQILSAETESASVDYGMCAKIVLEQLVSFEELDVIGFGSLAGESVNCVSYPESGHQAISIQCLANAAINLGVYSKGYVRREFRSKVRAFEPADKSQCLVFEIDEKKTIRGWVFLWSPRDENGEILPDAVLMEFFAENIMFRMSLAKIPANVTHEMIVALFSKVKARILENWKAIILPCFEAGMLDGPMPKSEWGSG